MAAETGHAPAGLTPDQIADDLKQNLNANVITVPAMVLEFTRLQLKGLIFTTILPIHDVG